MSATKIRMPGANRSQAVGFSLIELLIALVFISVLMAGMLRIFGSTIQGFSAANESVKAQRDNRVALDSLDDDLSGAGYQFPGASNVIPFSVDSTSGQNPLMLLPSQTITVKMSNPVAPGTLQPAETLTFDEFQFTTDMPLPVIAHLTAAAPSGALSFGVQCTQGSMADLRAGDMVVFMDGQGQNPPDITSIDASYTPSSVTAGTIPLSSSLGQSAPTGAYGSGGGGLSNAHPINVEVLFIRPAQVVRYTLLPLSLDPANAAATVPCLVRDQGPYPATGSRITWPAAGAAMPTGFSRVVIAENVSGLRFDISADQGKTWTRGATWPATVANLDTALSALAAANPQSGYATAADNAAQPQWYRYAPVLIRVDVTTRTVLKRAEYSATGTAAAYRTRTQTLLVQPHNYGLGG